MPASQVRSVDAPLFENGVHAQIDGVTEKKGPGKLEDLIYSGDTWTVG